MAIAKNPKRNTNNSKVDEAVKSFIVAAGKTSVLEDAEKLVQTPVRFPPSLLQ